LGNEGIYELAILDLGLPQRSGIDVLKNWRAKQNTLPVLILTARDAWYEKVDGFKAGADDYLGKPFHTEELLARINALLHRVHQHSGGKLQVGGLKLDEDRQQVITETDEVHELTGIEFKLLRCFLLHPDQVLSKSTLMEHIYDIDSDKDSNVIEVYINHYAVNWVNTGSKPAEAKVMYSRDSLNEIIATAFRCWSVYQSFQCIYHFMVADQQFNSLSG